eukprot:TRINITY_DN4002_c0_g1_i1.p1 TRINITY_DN4002_c0_g1~~TRINITY_DN4002_c0_g1_i1.p1  ORF type:complete len:344 (+),score=54.00 TRINITY_DN4002_c0_g1_i1:37-1068(+)
MNPDGGGGGCCNCGTKMTNGVGLSHTMNEEMLVTRLEKMKDLIEELSSELEKKAAECEDLKGKVVQMMPPTQVYPTRKDPASVDISSLRSQVKVRDDTITQMRKKFAKESNTMSAKIVELKRALIEQQERNNHRRGASHDDRRYRPTANDETLDKIRTYVDKTMGRVSAVLSQVAELEKKGTRRSESKKALIGVQNELAIGKQMVAEADSGTRKVVGTPNTARGSNRHDDNQHTQHSHSHSHSHSQHSQHSQRSKHHNKSPVPPLSISELRMRSPRLNVSPKNPHLSQVPTLSTGRLMLKESQRHSRRDFQQPNTARRSTYNSVPSPRIKSSRSTRTSPMYDY